MGLFDRVRSIIEAELDSRIDAQSGTGPVYEPLEKVLKEDGYGRKGLLFDPFQDQGYSGGLFRPKGAGSGFISPFLLKIVSRRDPIASTILHVRSDQAAAFCRKQSNRFDTGFKIQSHDNKKSDPDEIRQIEEFILNCGLTENRSSEDKLSFPDFGYMITHDFLTYGHCAIEKVLTKSGDLHSFLPLPAETIFYANKALINTDSVGLIIDTYKDSYQTALGSKKVDPEPEFDREYEYLQVINGKVVEGFKKDELVFTKVYELSEVDLNGYAIGPLERAVGMITAHLQIENHQKMFFTHGVASRGLLVIQGDVTPNQLRTLQAQWTNQVTQPHNAWRTPILAGIKGVQWEPLTIANRDMEYAAYQDHVLRTIHAVFAIDPEETGFGYLSKGVSQKSLGESSNEFKLTASRDRGLRPLLARIESIINDEILPVWNNTYAKKYRFCFVGLDAENREEELARLQAEVQLHTTLNEVREQASMDPMPIGGGLIMNPLFVDVLQKNLPKGLFMEKFLGVKGASQRPDLQYVPDPLWFQWQQFQMQLAQQQAAAEQGQNPQDPNAPQDPNDPNAPPQGGGEGGEGEGGQPGQPQDGQPQQDLQAQQEMMAQQQARAVDQFIQSNPDLFKSMHDTLAHTKYRDLHVDQLKDHLVKDFEQASERLMKEIFEAVKEDLSEHLPEGVTKSDPISADEKEDLGDFLNEKGLLKEAAKKKKAKKSKDKDKDTKLNGAAAIDPEEDRPNN